MKSRFNTIIVFIFFLCFVNIYSDNSSIEKTAYELVDIIQNSKEKEFISFIMQSILEKDKKLAKHKDDIYKLIDDYLHSDEYMELRIELVMHYFTIDEMNYLITYLKNPDRQRTNKEFNSVLRRYKKTYDQLEKRFVVYVYDKMEKKFLTQP